MKIKNYYIHTYADAFPKLMFFHKSMQNLWSKHKCFFKTLKLLKHKLF